MAKPELDNYTQSISCGECGHLCTQEWVCGYCSHSYAHLAQGPIDVWSRWLWNDNMLPSDDVLSFFQSFLQSVRELPNYLTHEINIDAMSKHPDYVEDPGALTRLFIIGSSKTNAQVERSNTISRYWARWVCRWNGMIRLAASRGVQLTDPFLPGKGQNEADIMLAFAEFLDIMKVNLRHAGRFNPVSAREIRYSPKKRAVHIKALSDYPRRLKMWNMLYEGCGRAEYYMNNFTFKDSTPLMLASNL